MNKIILKLLDYDPNWFPFLELRPKKEEAMSEQMLVKATLGFGVGYGAVTSLVIYVVSGELERSLFAFFFISVSVGLMYRYAYAPAWDNRARVLRSEDPELLINNKDIISFEQKKRTVRFTFKFLEDKILYSTDFAGSVSNYKINYTSITNSKSTVIDKNEWYRNVGVLWLLIGLIVEVLPALAGNSQGFLWTFLGSMMLGVYRYNFISYSKFDSHPANLLIIKDKDHDEIYDAILEKRNKFVMSQYGAIDEKNDPTQEKERFRYLLEEEIITPELFEDRMKELDKRAKRNKLRSPMNFL